MEQLRKHVGQPVRRRMPETRASFSHKFSIAGHEGYFTVGLFEDGRPGELFIAMAGISETGSNAEDGEKQRAEGYGLSSRRTFPAVSPIQPG